jgi:hypothetical protein
VTTTSAQSSAAKSNITATCPAGKTLVGGGADTNHTDAWIVNSGPGTVSSGKATTWTADADEHNGTNGQWTLTVYAICATDQ